MRRAALFLLLLAVAGCGGGGESEEEATPATDVGTTTGVEVSDSDDGRAIFLQNCSGCHTLKAAGTTGKVGPNLDETKPSEQRVITMVTKGGGGGLGVMPAFKGSLSEAQIRAVSKYVAESAGA